MNYSDLLDKHQGNWDLASQELEVETKPKSDAVLELGKIFFQVFTNMIYTPEVQKELVMVDYLSRCYYEDYKSTMALLHYTKTPFDKCFSHF